MKISELAILFVAFQSTCTFGASLEDEVITTSSATKHRNNVRTHRQLAEYKYYANMECQPSFCQNWSDICQVTSMMGTSYISYSSSYCHVSISNGAELTCTEECALTPPAPTPPAPTQPAPTPSAPTPAEYKYYADMECQPSFCQEWNDICQVTSMTGTSYISYSSSYCNVSIRNGAELTCTEACISPVPTPTPHTTCSYSAYSDATGPDTTGSFRSFGSFI